MMDIGSLTYVLFRGDIRRTVMEEDMYVDKIGMIFKVSSRNLYLTEEATNTTVFPLSSGQFATIYLANNGHYEVHGDPAFAGQHTSSADPAFADLDTSSADPAFADQDTSSAAVSMETLHSLPQASQKPSTRSIIVAEVKRQHSRSHRISFAEKDANVKGITEKAMAVLDTNVPLALLDSKGNKILDSKYSKGLDWWESKQVIYAMPDDDFVEIQSGRSADTKRQMSEDRLTVQGIIGDIGQLKQAAEGLDEITSTLDQLSDLAGIKNASASLHEPLLEAFGCLVCKGTMEEPMYSTCCCSLLGCQTCVLHWLFNSDRCLKCRAEDLRFNLHKVEGLDHVLSSLRAMETGD